MTKPKRKQRLWLRILIFALVIVALGFAVTALSIEVRYKASEKSAASTESEYNGDYYYAAYKGKLVVDKYFKIPITSCDLPIDFYEFGADGKMLNGIIEKDGVLYYYENGKGAEKGLFEYEGNYYYSVYKGKLVTSRDFKIVEGNGLLLETVYTFNELGQIIG